MNKIDDFFKKRLDATSSQDEGWNMPSDDLWNAAKPHFPQEKRKNRFIWYWFLLGLIVVGSVLFSTRIGFSDASSELIVDHVEQSINEKENIVTTDDKEESQKSFLSYNDKSDVHSTKLSDPKSLKSQSTTIAQDNIEVTPVSKSESVDNTAEILSNDHDANRVNNDTSGSLNVDNTDDSYNLTQKSDAEKNPKNTDDILREDLNVESQQVVRQNILGPPLLSNFSSTDIQSEDETEVINKGSLMIAPHVVVRPKKEVGMSSQLFLLGLLNGVDLDDSPDGRIVFDGRYRNLNFKYTHWIARKWSISTGINFSDLAVNLDFDADVLYDEDEFAELIDSEYGEAINRNYNSDSDKIVQLIAGAELVNGDLVRLNGRADLGLKAIQVPIILNYHWYNRRVEFYTSLGVTLETIWASEENVNFELFKDGELISEPVGQKEIDENYLDLSVYTKLGTKFNFTPKLNLDINLSILATEVIFSGIEIGVHYRWYK